MSQWTASTNEEMFHDLFGTRDEGETYWVGKVVPVVAKDICPDGDSLLDQMVDRAYDLIGEAAEGWADGDLASDELTKNVYAVVDDWLAKQATRLFRVVEVTEHTVGFSDG